MNRQVGVSNTEVQQANACELQWAFGFHPELNYQLREMTEARQRGILGHSALEIFYKGLKAERDYDDCAQAALSFVQDLRVKELMAGDFVDPKVLAMLNYLYKVLERYFEMEKPIIGRWEILEVEDFHAVEQEGEDDFYLPSRMDLVIYQREGEFKGEVSPVDYKFVYDFWHKPKFVLNAQFPLYILALRAARYAGKPKPVVRRAIVKQFRTRFEASKIQEKSNDELFRETPWAYSSTRLQTVFKNHMKSAVHLAYLKRLPLSDAMEEIKASLGSMACQYCDFKEICDITFEEGDPSNVISATLKKNEYGYPPLEEIRRERD